MSSYDPNQPGQPYDPQAGSQAPQSNPYGQNPYGQNPYGTPAHDASTQPGGMPQYGAAQYGTPQYAAPLQGGYTPVQMPETRPKSLTVAFLLIVAAGIVSAIASWLLSTSNVFSNMIASQWSMLQPELERQLQNTPEAANDPAVQRMLQGPDGFMDQFNSMLTGGMAVSLVISIVLYFLVGFAVGRGVGALRVIATILAVLSLFGLFGSMSLITQFADASEAGMLNALTAAGVLLGVAGVVFAWVPESSKYIRERRLARQAGYR